jgi:precorrin-3B synthase
MEAAIRSRTPMSLESAHKRGFCPRVWTPMASGDGLIVRVHPGLAELQAERLRTLVTLAERYGNGQIDVTRRANLQLRGIDECRLPALQQALVESGWAAPSQAGERHFALLASPLLALDAKNAPLAFVARELERALLTSAAPGQLHPKLCIAVDDAERLLRDQPFDLALWPSARDSRLVELAVSDAEKRPVLLGSCALEDALPLVLGVIDLLSTQTTRPLRMHEWAAVAGLGSLLAALSPKLVRAEGQGDGLSGAAPTLIGAQRRARSWFGLALPFGSGSGDQWRTLLGLSEQFGDGALRLTTRREVLLLDVPERAHAALLEAAEDAGFICRADDPLARVTACTGAPLCSAAHGETRALARTLAQVVHPFLMHGGRLHVSGCVKSCAHSGASELTLVHAADGVHLARHADAAQAVEKPALSRAQLESALAALAHEYATCPKLR